MPVNVFFCLKEIFMKEVMAIIRPGKWQATKAKLMEMAISSYTTCRVAGRGRQKGLKYLSRQGGTTGMRTVPKRMVWLWLHEDQVESVVQALMNVNRTGAIGDGKIFVCPAVDAIRLRTGDRGALAVY
jgi:nitrogen regulatory protein PII 2